MFAGSCESKLCKVEQVLFFLCVELSKLLFSHMCPQISQASQMALAVPGTLERLSIYGKQRKADRLGDGLPDFTDMRLLGVV